MNEFSRGQLKVLWHVDVFRRSFRQFKGHTCVGESCIFCALQEKILEQIHFHLTGSDDLDSCSAAHCLSHQKCSLSVFEMALFVQFQHSSQSALPPDDP
ncbi:Inactive ubiquitin carboxyl-terminal hydrolase 54 [Geodia barretti]|uniref:Inactive ubiquitin carboxyl-terminal hydrolase 54 n=1 Tax=Geodia barretti TaxID=519541 RepID=A0AA35RYE5_GEOBA|nr:Inactive ubiquitin carboxyl-terminal hydrolase 54 [Geodia barretti]